MNTIEFLKECLEKKMTLADVIKNLESENQAKFDDYIEQRKSKRPEKELERLGNMEKR